MIKRFFDRDFEFGGTLRDLNESKGNYYGVYIFVLPSDFGKVDFNETANLEKWRDRKVAVSIDELQNRWLKDADVLYIGKSESKTVYKRVLEHLKFWGGENVSAFGGRIIGQIQNYENLHVWYMKCEYSEKVKKELLCEFKNKYRQLPFANWQE